MQELNICEILGKQDDLRREFSKEAQLIQDKFARELQLYREASKELNEINCSFNQKWDPIMNPYRKELSALKRKYNRLAKEL